FKVRSLRRWPPCSRIPIQIFPNRSSKDSNNSSNKLANKDDDMTALTQIIIQHPFYSQLCANYVDALLKSFLVLASAGDLSPCWQRGSAASRHLIWLLAMVSLPLLLIAILLMPTRRPLATVSTDFTSGNQISVTLALLPQRVTDSSAASRTAPDAMRTTTAQSKSRTLSQI